MDILLISWFKPREICVGKECKKSSWDLKGDNTKAILRNGSNNFDSGCCRLLQSPFLPFLPRSINFSRKDFCSQHSSTKMEKLIVLGKPTRTYRAITLKKAVDDIFLLKVFLFIELVFVNPWNHDLNRLASDFWNVVTSRNLFLGILVLTYAWWVFVKVMWGRGKCNKLK